jgi:hypothetical protein
VGVGDERVTLMRMTRLRMMRRWLLIVKMPSLARIRSSTYRAETNYKRTTASTLGPLFATMMHRDRQGIACTSGQGRMGVNLQVGDHPDHCNLITEARCKFAARGSSTAACFHETVAAYAHRISS